MYCAEWGTVRRLSGFGLLLVALLALPATAQITVGSETSMSLNGEVGAGYAGSIRQ